MVQFLEQAINLKVGEDFSVDERDLLAVSFKNFVGSERSAIRTIGAIKQNKKYKNFFDSLTGY